MPAASIMRHPTAGYLLDFAHGAEPGPLSAKERAYLRDLAEKVLTIAQEPEQTEKREQWYRHNALKPGRPLVLLFPENAWEEVLPEDQMQVQDPFWKNQEWYLRHLIYRDAHFPDDFVIEPELMVPLVIYHGRWGLHGTIRRPSQDKGAWKADAAILDPNDIKKVTRPTVAVDEAATQRVCDALCEIFGDSLAVRVDCMPPLADLIGVAAGLRGIEQLMMDMHDRPEWLHELMSFVADAVFQEAKYLEDHGYLTLNNRGHYNDSGGVGYSRELPAPDFDGQHVRLCDLWGFGVAQEMALVGPVQHKEFLLDYQVRILEHFGLNAYGCCESYTTKFDMLENIPRLRRVSVSPWCDIQVAAERLSDRCIFSWKPHPAMIVGGFDSDAIRRYIRRTLDIARGCVLEMILKDTYTVEYHPDRLDTWARIARQEIEGLA
ncbi:MAG: hypothetical protein V1800_08165 [Candidatus Latescibacterota bacterium]